MLEVVLEVVVLELGSNRLIGASGRRKLDGATLGVKKFK
jgi:hypothetical protein